MTRPVGRLLALDVPLALVVATGAVGTARVAALTAGTTPGRYRGGYGPPSTGTPGAPPWLDGPATPLNWWLVPVLAVLVAAIVLRRRRPRTGYGLAAAAAAGYLALGHPHGPAVLGLVLAGLALTGALAPREWWPWALLAVPALAVPLVWSGASLGNFGAWGSWLSSLTVVGLALAVGTALRSRRRAGDAERELQARRYAYRERLRIAADVHDIVGHSLSVITMQAGVALHVLDRRPGQAEEALRAIRATGNAALTELRATLDTFRDPDFDPVPPNGASLDAPASSRSPQPGLERLDELVDALAVAGCRVEVVRRRSAGPAGGDEAELPGAWPAAVDQAAYRIVQESLTNVVRHAAGADARVEIVQAPTSVSVTVTDRGPGPGPHPGDGHGLTGMAERARALGGSLRAGPGRDGGFEVTAELPLPVSTAAER